VSTRPIEPDEESDDDAFHWAGDEARGQAAPRLRGADEIADPDAAVATEGAEPAAAVVRRSPAETAFLVATGVFAGLYLAVVVGWILSVQLLSYPGLDLAGEIMWQFAEFLAMVAAALWFAAVISLTPDDVDRRALTRFVWLAAGLALLVPWPFLLGAFG